MSGKLRNYLEPGWPPGLGSAYFTISVTVVECAIPDVAVTVTANVPVGVPGTGAGAIVELLPHRTSTATSVNSARHRMTFGSRRFRERMNPTPSTSMPESDSHRAYAETERKDLGGVVALMEGAVVEIVSVDELEAPASATELGLKEHVAFDGNPEHASAMLPLKLPNDCRVSV